MDKHISFFCKQNQNRNVVFVLRRHLMDKQNHHITISLGGATVEKETSNFLIL